MESRIEKLFGIKKIPDLENFVAIEPMPQISIYSNDSMYLAVYGKIANTKPDEVVYVNLKEMAKDFSDEADIIEYIMNGTKSAKYDKQKEIISVCKFGDQIRRKAEELDVLIKKGKTSIELKCPSTYSIALRNYAKKRYSFTAVKEDAGKLFFEKDEKLV